MSAGKAALGAGLAGGLAGALLMSALTPPRSSEASPLEIDGIAALDRHVQELTAALADASHARALPATRGEPDGAPPIETLQSGPFTDLTPLIARLDGLIARLEASDGVGGGAPFQFPDEKAIQLARRELHWTNDSEFKAIHEAHRLMTYRQIAQRYGRPFAIQVNENGSVDWTYDTEGSSYSFTFVDGLCR